MPPGGALVLEAAAADAESLARVKDVMQRDLEKFGARRELIVSWGPEGSGAVPPRPYLRRRVRDADRGPSDGHPHRWAPSHTGPVPQAVEAGCWIYVSALFGADPVGHAIPEDTKAEAEQIFTNLVAILAAAGTDLTNVVRVGIVMRDLPRDRPALKQGVGRAFRRPPARPVGHRVTGVRPAGGMPGS